MDALTQIVTSAMEILIKSGISKNNISGDSIILPKGREELISDMLSDDFIKYIDLNSINEILTGLFEYFKMLRMFGADMSLFDFYWGKVAMRVERSIAEANDSE